MRFRRVKRRARPWWLGCALSIVAGAAVAHAETVIPWDEAEKHVGEDVVVEGRVLGVRCSQLSCLLAFDPTLNRFTAVVQAANFKDLPPEKLEQLYSGKQVRVRGKVTQSERKPEIVVRSPADITLTAGERHRDRQERDARREQAEAEALERLATVLDRLADVTDRMAAAQDRMEAVLTQLEQREAAAAAAAVQASQAPPAPASYGEPQPRPAYEALRTVKRGMSATDVRRLVGDPTSVESSGGGWTTWYYGYGRSITFDTRGRATALVGFPPP